MPETGRDIVCLASSSWDAMWVNAQHLMHRLAADHRILYVNNLGLRAPGASRGDWAKIKRRLREWFAGARLAEENLWVISPVSVPLHRFRAIRAFNRWNLRRTLRRYSKNLGFKRPILWSFLPLGAQLAGRLGESLLIYHCVDDYAANPGVPEQQVREMEERLLRLADLTIATNPLLYEERRAKTKRAVYLGNVANTEHFLNAGPTAPPAALAALPRPIIGYQGNISGYKTDLDLLAGLARARPDWSFVLVGPIGWGDPHTDVTALRALPNVHFSERVGYDDLPGYVRAFDVGLLPLRDNESTRRSFPMKFYEYMAAGKPIVATNLPAFAAFRERPELCRTARDVESFLSAIEEALADPVDHQAARLAEARKNSWSVRAAEIRTLVDEAWAARNGNG